MNTDVGWPTPPVREMVIPGVWARRSDMTTAWLCRMSARSSTVTELPIRSRGVGARLATTTTSWSEESDGLGAVCALAMAEATAQDTAVAAAAYRDFTAELPWRIDPSDRAGARVDESAHTSACRQAPQRGPCRHS